MSARLGRDGLLLPPHPLGRTGSTNLIHREPHSHKWAATKLHNMPIVFSGVRARRIPARSPPKGATRSPHTATDDPRDETQAPPPGPSAPAPVQLCRATPPLVPVPWPFHTTLAGERLAALGGGRRVLRRVPGRWRGGRSPRRGSRDLSAPLLVLPDDHPGQPPRPGAVPLRRTPATIDRRPTWAAACPVHQYGRMRAPALPCLCGRPVPAGAGRVCTGQIP